MSPRSLGENGTPATRDDANAVRAATGTYNDRVARVIESDSLLRLHAVTAACDLGFSVVTDASVTPPSRPPVVDFVGLDNLAACLRCTPREADRVRAECGSAEDARAPITVGYVGGPLATLAAHVAHACTDLCLGLRAIEGRAAFVYLVDASLPAASRRVGGDAAIPATLAGLSAREADVLLFVLAGMPSATIAARLGLSSATVRSHRRAILRKCGAANGRTLRAHLLAASESLDAAGPCLEPVSPTWLPLQRQPGAGKRSHPGDEKPAGQRQQEA